MSQGSAGYNQGPGANTKFATVIDEVSGETLHFQQIVPFNPGVWGYTAGDDGLVDLGANDRLLSLAAVAGGADGSVSVNGGFPIPIPAGRSFEMSIEADLRGPTIEFTGTITYVVQFVTED